MSDERGSDAKPRRMGDPPERPRPPRPPEADDLPTVFDRSAYTAAAPRPSALAGELPTVVETGAARPVPRGSSDPGGRVRRADDFPDRFQVRGSLGAGGMGQVHLAQDCELHRDVALKVIHDPALTDRFIEETQILGQLDHPNIVPLHGVGTTVGGLPYCVLRYVRGQTLAEVVAALRRGDGEATTLYTRTRMMQIFLQITQAIAYAHQRGVVHRDLKPSNVMLGEHGEVQVLDWGLSKVLRAAVDEPPTDVPPDLAGDGLQRPVLVSDSAPPTALGQVLGTLPYMPPEQIAGKPVDTQADVWSLGVMLYELLTLERPFRGEDPIQLQWEICNRQPIPPSARRPHGAVPAELETVCLQALSKQPGDRPASASVLGAAVRAWLEASADKDKRHRLAEAKVAEGQMAVERYRTLASRIRELEDRIARESGRYPSWQSVDAKAALYALEDELIAARAGLVEAASDVVDLLAAALEQEPAHSTGRRLLAEFYWQRFLGTEGRGDRAEMGYYRTLVEQYHDGRFATELAGTGRLRLESDPLGASVTLHLLEERELCLVPGAARPLGRTPLGPIELAMGSYVAVVELAGYVAVRYPIHITRNRAWTGLVTLNRPGDVPVGFIQIPAGPFVLGGEALSGNSLPRAEPWVDDFFIARDPVTMGDYIEFLDSLDPVEARMRAPRAAHEVPTYLVATDAGLRLPERDEAGDAWDPRRPAMGISAFDAEAYCEWRSRRDGFDYRLPTEIEWEKAARGVDGRRYPWGERFDASLCNMRDSRRELQSTVVVDAFATDVSVYGVRGLAGNMRDWTATVVDEGHDQPSRVVRGGAWFIPASFTCVGHRDWFPPTLVGAFHGFRLAVGAARVAGADRRAPAPRLR